ncbi:hypothetical protein VZT92_001657 [Zoarces viviparus]|uniref:Calponin-homology (CH) domain-containing protein n=1 Tax=Zoarces viviparus TaxID=48416 RepID=A0AAW1G699_ZOAVI
MDRELNGDELQQLYAWIDKIPLSRPKRHIARDFSDGVMAAEVVKYFFPKLVDLHNYTATNTTQQKLSNWNLLNRKVFSKLNFHVPEKTVKRIALSTAGVIEPVLNALRENIVKKLEHTTDVCTDLENHDTGAQGKPHTDQAGMALQKTTELLQMKVNRLERLVQLKDLRIEDLKQRLETKKANGNEV